MTTTTTTSSTPTAPTAVSATNPVLTYEQLLARPQDHHASALKFAEMAGMELRANSTGFDLFKDYELITESRSAVDVSNFLWGYINGRDDANEVAADKALLLTEESDDGGANMLLALDIADRYGWTIEIARTGLTITGMINVGHKFTERLDGLSDFFAFANGFHNALEFCGRLRGGINDLEADAAARGADEGVVA